MRGVLSLILQMHERLWKTYRTIRAWILFPNVPSRLTVFVRDHMLEYKRTGDRNLLYLEAAEGVIRQYLRTSAFDQKRHNGNYLDSRQINTAGEISYVFPVRVLLLGESLF